MLDQIHYDINAELSNLQEQYDTETDFSRDFEQQVLWQKRIEIELATLERFKSTR